MRIEADDEDSSHRGSSLLRPVELKKLVHFVLRANGLAEFEEMSRRIVQFPKAIEIKKAVEAAQIERNVM